MVKENEHLTHQKEKLEVSNNKMIYQIKNVNETIAVYKQKVQDNYNLQSSEQRKRHAKEFESFQYQCFEQLAAKDTENIELRNVCFFNTLKFSLTKY